MSLIRVFQIVLSGGRGEGGKGEKILVVLGEWEILLGLEFFVRWWASEKEYIWPFNPFSK